MAISFKSTMVFGGTTFRGTTVYCMIMDVFDAFLYY